MKRTIYLILFAFIAISAMAQSPTQNPDWVLRGRYLKFANTVPYAPGTPVTLPSITQSSSYANSYCDASGNVLFYVIDGMIYNGQGDLCDMLYSGYSIVPSSEISIVPDPGNCKKFYLFYGTDGNFPAAYYSILDVSAPPYYMLVADTYGNTAYELTAVNANNFRHKFGFAASKLRSDNTRFIFVNKSSSVYRYKLSATGLSLDGTIPPQLYIMDESYYGVYSETELNESIPGIYQLACLGNSVQGPDPAIPDGGNYIYKINLDANGNYIAGSAWYYNLLNVSTLSSPTIHGLEFSPDGNYLYYSHEIIPGFTNPVEYLTSATHVNNVLISASMTSAADLKYSEMEIGPDGKLYFAATNKLTYLSNPNSPNVANYNNTGIALIGTNWSYLLPDQVDGMNYYLAYPSVFAGNDKAICKGNSTTLTAIGSSSGGTYVWSPGGQTGATISVAPQTTTTYTVTYTMPGGCTATDAVVVTVNPLPTVNLGPDQYVCATGPFPLLNAGNPGSTYVWKRNGAYLPNTTQTLQTTSIGTYAVMVTLPTGCYASDEVNILAAPNLTGIFTATYGCNNNTMYINVASTEVCAAQVWYLYKNNVLQATSNGTNPTSWVFNSSITPNTTYVVKHTVTSYCNVQTTYSLTVYTNMAVINPTFNYSKINNPNSSYGIVATCSLPANASFTWSVEEVDANGVVIPGTSMNNSNPYWWINPNSCNFAGYCCNNSGTSPGVFYNNHRYKITHGTWSNCSPWASAYTIVYFNQIADKELKFEIISSENATYVPSKDDANVSQDFEIYPNPVRDILTIRLSNSNGMTYTVNDMLGKVKIPVTVATGNSIQLNVSDWENGIYIIRNSSGVIKKFSVIK